MKVGSGADANPTSWAQKPGTGQSAGGRRNDRMLLERARTGSRSGSRWHSGSTWPLSSDATLVSVGTTGEGVSQVSGGALQGRRLSRLLVGRRAERKTASVTLSRKLETGGYPEHQQAAVLAAARAFWQAIYEVRSSERSPSR